MRGARPILQGARPTDAQCWRSLAGLLGVEVDKRKGNPRGVGRCAWFGRWLQYKRSAIVVERAPSRERSQGTSEVLLRRDDVPMCALRADEKVVTNSFGYRAAEPGISNDSCVVHGGYDVERVSSLTMLGERRHDARTAESDVNTPMSWGHCLVARTRRVSPGVNRAHVAQS